MDSNEKYELLLTQLRAKEGFICDMDGVIYHGNKILPGVPEFIDWLQRTGKEYLFLTNNSGCTPLELKQKLARMGLDVPEARFYTSALATAAFGMLLWNPNWLGDISFQLSFLAVAGILAWGVPLCRRCRTRPCLIPGAEARGEPSCCPGQD